nr:MAG TPA: hypothetical protein [Caudoviricetes sp.]
MIESKNSESTSTKKFKNWGKKRLERLNRTPSQKSPRPDMHSRLTSFFFSFIYSNFFFFFSLFFFLLIHFLFLYY